MWACKMDGCTRNAFRSFFEEILGKWPSGRMTRREDNINMDHRQTML